MTPELRLVLSKFPEVLIVHFQKMPGDNYPINAFCEAIRYIAEPTLENKYDLKSYSNRVRDDIRFEKIDMICEALIRSLLDNNPKWLEWADGDIDRFLKIEVKR